MRSFSNLFSVQNFVLSLVSINALVTASAIPVRSDSTLFRRASVNVGGKSGELGKKLSASTHSKSTVHQLSSWDGKANPGAVVKTYSTGSVKPKEVAGLKAAGQYIHHDDKSVVMHEVKGTPLSKIVAATPHDQRKAVVDHYKPMVAAHAADIAKNKGVLHSDLNMNNVVVHPQGHVQLVDWEHYHDKNSQHFTADKDKIHQNLDLVWDSTQTPPDAKSSSRKSKSPKRRSLSRRAVLYVGN